MSISTPLSRSQTIMSWIGQVLAAIILLQTLFFKFTAAPESVYIFTQMGIEPWGRIATGIAELIASVLLLVPRMAALGGLLSLAIISGAIVSHLTVLGIALTEVGDSGELFLLAILVFVASLLVVWLRRHALPFVGDRF